MIYKTATIFKSSKLKTTSEDDLKNYLKKYSIKGGPEKLYLEINNIVRKYIHLKNKIENKIENKIVIDTVQYNNIICIFDIAIGRTRHHGTLLSYYYLLIRPKKRSFEDQRARRSIMPGSSPIHHAVYLTANITKYATQETYTKFIIYEDNGEIIKPYINPNKTYTSLEIHYNKAQDIKILNYNFYTKYLSNDTIILNNKSSQKLSKESIHNTINKVKSTNTINKDKSTNTINKVKSTNTIKNVKSTNNINKVKSTNTF